MCKASEIRDGAEVWLIPRRQYSKSDILHQSLLDPPRRKDSHAIIAIDQDLGHHPRVIRRLAALFLFIHSLDLRKVQLVHHVGDEIGQVVIRQPLTKACGQQQILFCNVGSECFLPCSRKTGTPSGPFSRNIQQNGVKFSDTLLEVSHFVLLLTHASGH